MYPEDPGSVTAKIRVSINDIVYLTEETSTGVDSHSNPIMVPVHISDLEFSINIDVEASSEYPGLLMISPDSYQICSAPPLSKGRLGGV